MDTVFIIFEFSGKFEFLSNFHSCLVKYEGMMYPSSEHAYQAAKTTNPKTRAQIALCKTPGQAKRAGQKVDKRDHWEGIKIQIMHDIVLDKFIRNNDLSELLIATGNAKIIEGNNWGDTFWGVCGKKGKNHLGRILMEVRKEIA